MTTAPKPQRRIRRGPRPSQRRKRLAASSVDTKPAPAVEVASRALGAQPSTQEDPVQPHKHALAKPSPRAPIPVRRRVPCYIKDVLQRRGLIFNTGHIFASRKSNLQFKIALLGDMDVVRPGTVDARVREFFQVANSKRAMITKEDHGWDNFCTHVRLNVSWMEKHPAINREHVRLFTDSMVGARAAAKRDSQKDTEVNRGCREAQFLEELDDWMEWLGTHDPAHMQRISGNAYYYREPRESIEDDNDLQVGEEKDGENNDGSGEAMEYTRSNACERFDNVMSTTRDQMEHLAIAAEGKPREKMEHLTITAEQETLTEEMEDLTIAAEDEELGEDWGTWKSTSPI